MSVCLRCGKCCYVPKYEDPEIPTCLTSWGPCKHLVRLKSGKTVCRVFHTRLGTKIDERHVCVLREESNFDYEGCPFNTDKPIRLVGKKS